MTRTILLAASCLFACATTGPRPPSPHEFVATGPRYPAREPGCTIETFRTAAPAQAYVEVGQIEIGCLDSCRVAYVYERATAAACALGADALVGIAENDTGWYMTRFRATAARWSAREAAPVESAQR